MMAPTRAERVYQIAHFSPVTSENATSSAQLMNKAWPRSKLARPVVG